MNLEIIQEKQMNAKYRNIEENDLLIDILDKIIWQQNEAILQRMLGIINKTGWIPNFLFHQENPINFNGENLGNFLF